MSSQPVRELSKGNLLEESLDVWKAHQDPDNPNHYVFHRPYPKREFIPEESPYQEHSGKVRLKWVRNRVFWGYLSQEDIGLLCDIYSSWLDQDEYLVLKGTNLKTLEEKHLAVKCSKRGNDVFSSRLNRKLGFLKDDIQFFNPKNFESHANFKPKTGLLWVTFTYDPSRCSLHQCYMNFMREWNIAITKLRQKYGKISYVSFPQPFPNSKGLAYGYRHLHVIMLFEEYRFSVFRHFGKDREGNFEIQYRIKEKNEFLQVSGWHSHIDIRALHSMHAVYKYAKKHHLNAVFNESPESLVNNAVLWFYKKKSYNPSKHFRKKYLEFIEVMQVSKKSLQLDLFGQPAILWQWSALGVFSLEELKIPTYADKPPPWVCVVEEDLVIELLESRSR